MSSSTTEEEMPRTLLVVDDSATIRRAVCDALTGEDWTVLTASNRTEAVNLVREKHPDLVLCDVSLVESDGYGVCREIRSAEGKGAPPVIMMGGKVSEAGAKEAGAVGTLVKPFESDELQTALRNGLDEGELDLGLEGFSEDAELLTLDNPLPDLADSAQSNEEVEIIDLSGDDEFGHLEVLVGLEPIDSADARAQADLGVLPARDPMESAVLDLSDLAPIGDEPLSSKTALDEIELDNLLAEEPSPAPAVGPIDSKPDAGDDFEFDLAEFEKPEPKAMIGGDADPVFPAGRASEAEPAVESAPDEFTFDALEIEERLEAAAPPSFAPVDPEPQTPSASPEPVPPQAEPSFNSAPREPEKREEPTAGEPPPVQGATFGVLVKGRLGATAERAVREALEASLSPEKLTPVLQSVVERVVWDVVPVLAERLIREAIEKLRNENP